MSLVVVEMLILSWAGSYAYSHISFMHNPVKKPGTLWRVIKHNIK